MLSSNMLLLNLIPLIDVTFSTPTPGYNICPSLISLEQSFLTVGQAYLVHSAPFD
jgi:hypothetical protein